MGQHFQKAPQTWDRGLWNEVRLFQQLKQDANIHPAQIPLTRHQQAASTALTGLAGGHSDSEELHTRMQHLHLLIYMCWGNALWFFIFWFSIMYSDQRWICTVFRNAETFSHHWGWENHHPNDWSRKIAHRVVVEEQQCVAAFPVLSSFPALPAKLG